MLNVLFQPLPWLQLCLMERWTVESREFYLDRDSPELSTTCSTKVEALEWTRGIYHSPHPVSVKTHPVSVKHSEVWKTPPNKCKTLRDYEKPHPQSVKHSESMKKPTQ